MPDTHRHVPVALALILGLMSSSCLVARRGINRHGKPVTAASAPKLLNATRDQLNARIADFYNSLTSFQAKADLTPSVGSVYTGQITEIKDVLAYVLFRKPATIRIIGKYPLVGTTAFDMVSDGSRFKASLPDKSLFEIGANDAPRTSKSKLENLRPQDFLSSMLIMPVDAATEGTSLIDFIDEDNAFYVLNFVRQGEVMRQVWFDRLDLTIVRQMVWNQPSGELVSDTRYSKWTPYSGVMFPAHIDINRPKDEYGVVLDIIEMKMNTDLGDDKFVLNQPEGAQLREIGTAKQAP
jgi:outer membrane lipoprotein-sorting protein